jgi:hypothetical protein
VNQKGAEQAKWRRIPSTRSISRVSSESSRFKSSSRAENIKSRTSMRSQGDYRATKITTEAFMSSQVQARTWDESIEDSFEEGQLMKAMT